MTALIDGIWRIIVVVFGIGFFTFMTDLTYRLGRSAANAHQEGLVSLPELNRRLFHSSTEEKTASRVLRGEHPGDLHRLK